MSDYCELFGTKNTDDMTEICTFSHIFLSIQLLSENIDFVGKLACLS